MVPLYLLGTFTLLRRLNAVEEALNVYLKRYAGQNEKRGGSRTFVIADRGNRVVGYYTLTVGSIEQADAPAQVTKGMGKYSIPVVLLARLAIDKICSRPRIRFSSLKGCSQEGGVQYQ